MSSAEVEIPITAADELVAAGGWSRSVGLRPGTHYRRPIPGGRGCEHLRIEGSRAWIHRDRFDPHRSPLAHWIEVARDLWRTGGRLP